MQAINNLLQYQDEIRSHIKGVDFECPYGITIQLDVRDEIQAQKTIDRFHKKYKKVTGQRNKRANFIAITEKKYHFHCHILTDKPNGILDYEDRVNFAIDTTKQIYPNYNWIDYVRDFGWARYITKFENANDEFAIWEAK
jgi:hypothetical protein